MNARRFRAWVEHRESGHRNHIPSSDRILPLISQAGPLGLTKRAIGQATKLAPKTLDDLLAAFVQVGLLIVTDSAEGQVFSVPS